MGVFSFYYFGVCLCRGIALAETRKKAHNREEGSKRRKKNSEEQKLCKFVAMEMNVQLEGMKRKWEAIF